ncbi:MAG: hypothetical protein ACD_20C00380G0001 [uncultured bacterium]|nr:MAG: hypothetical protein ACD_20C00380G0001 [uncultured bacterium]
MHRLIAGAQCAPYFRILNQCTSKLNPTMVLASVILPSFIIPQAESISITKGSIISP